MKDPTTGEKEIYLEKHSSEKMIHKEIFLRKSQVSPQVLDYEKLEKASFYIKQDIIEIDELIEEFSKNKDEIEEFIKKGKKWENLKASNASKLIEEILFKEREKQITLNKILDTNEKQLFLTVTNKNESTFFKMKEEMIGKFDTTQRDIINKFIKNFKTYKKSKQKQKRESLGIRTENKQIQVIFLY